MVAKPQKIEYIDRKLLEEFPNHPFRVEMNEDMEELALSIFQHGLLSPLLVWEYARGKYYILSGHRRYFATFICEQADKPFPTLPCFVYRDIDIDTATLIMTSENKHRTRLLPSEKAWAYRMEMEALRRQGQRTDLTSVQVAQKLNEEEEDELVAQCATSQKKKSSQIIAEEHGESARQVAYYIRLTYLIQPLLDMVDLATLGFRAGVELSYLSDEQQEAVLEDIQKYKVPNLRQAKMLKEEAKKKALNREAIQSIISQNRLDDRITFRLKPDQLARLNEMSCGTTLNRSELLRNLSSNGQAVYVGIEAIDELEKTRNDITRVGNLMKMQTNRLDVIAENPFLLEGETTALLVALEDNKKLRQELKALKLQIDELCAKLNRSCNNLNAGKLGIK